MNEKLTHNLHSLVYLMDSSAERILDENFGISYNEFIILLSIRELEKPSQQEIASWTKLNKSTISKKIEKFQKLSWIKIKIEKDDRRNNQISLKSKSRKLVNKAERLLEEEFVSLREGLEEKDLLKFNKILNQLIINIQNYERQKD